MARTLITHVGTTTLGCHALIDHAKRFDYARVKRDLSFGDKCETERPQCIQELVEGLRRVWTTDDAQQRRRDSPAEIASLSLLHPRANDTIILLHSDTATGDFCATVLDTILNQNIAQGSDYPYCERTIVKPVPVPGLHIDDGDTSADGQARVGKQSFVRDGLASYVREMWKQYHQLKSRGGGELIFNVTGGYKGIIPIARDLTLLLGAHSRDEQQEATRRGMHRHVISTKLCYLYEESSELVEYEALPVAFPWATVPRQLLREAGNTGSVPSKDLTPADKVYFEDMLGKPGFSCRSPLGAVVWALCDTLGSVQDEIVVVPPGPAH